MKIEKAVPGGKIESSAGTPFLKLQNILYFQLAGRSPVLQRCLNMHDPVGSIRLADPGEQHICGNIAHFRAWNLHSGEMGLNDPRFIRIVESCDKDVVRDFESLFPERADQIDGNKIVGAYKSVRKLKRPSDGFRKGVGSVENSPSGKLCRKWGEIILAEGMLESLIPFGKRTAVFWIAGECQDFDTRSGSVCPSDCKCSYDFP